MSLTAEYLTIAEIASRLKVKLRHSRAAHDDRLYSPVNKLRELEDDLKEAARREVVPNFLTETSRAGKLAETHP